MRIAFLVTSSGISGGHNIIFEHAYHLVKRGHQVDIIGKSLNQFAYVYKWHDRALDLNFITIGDSVDSRSYDIAIATNFNSAFSLPLISADQYCLFMQANESDFSGESNTALKHWLASVLELDMPAIVSADWMRAFLHQLNGRDAIVCHSGVRKDIFSFSGLEAEPRPKSGLRILVEGPIDAPHKNVPATLDLCLSSDATEVWLLTSSRDLSRIPPGVRVFSSVATRDLGSIYRSCDLLVKLSTSEGMFGPPLEMLHCGGTVISYDVPGHEEYLVHGVNSLIVAKGDEGAVLHAVNHLSGNPELLATLKRSARITAEKWPDWKVASKSFEECLTWALLHPRVSPDKLSQATKNSTRVYLRERWLSRKRIIAETNVC